MITSRGQPGRGVGPATRADEEGDLALGDTAQDPLDQGGPEEPGGAGDEESLAAQVPLDRHRDFLAEPESVYHMVSAEPGTSDRILDAALASFATRGYEATSLDATAKSLDLTKQTILYWFPRKDALLKR